MVCPVKCVAISATGPNRSCGAFIFFINIVTACFPISYWGSDHVSTVLPNCLTDPTSTVVREMSPGIAKPHSPAARKTGDTISGVYVVIAVGRLGL